MEMFLMCLIYGIVGYIAGNSNPVKAEARFPVLWLLLAFIVFLGIMLAYLHLNAITIAYLKANQIKP